MDFLGFLAAVAGSVAWPVALVVVARMVKTHLEGGRTRTRDGEPAAPRVEGDRKVSELETAAAQTGLHAAPAGDGPSPAGAAALLAHVLRRGLDEQIDEVAGHNPAAALLLAWAGLEAELQATVDRLGLAGEGGYMRPVDAIYALQRRGAIDENLARVLHGLRDLRHEVAGAPAAAVVLSTDKARAYAILAQRTALTLRCLDRPVAGSEGVETPGESQALAPL